MFRPLARNGRAACYSDTDPECECIFRPAVNLRLRAYVAATSVCRFYNYRRLYRQNVALLFEAPAARNYARLSCH